MVCIFVRQVDCFATVGRCDVRFGNTLNKVQKHLNRSFVIRMIKTGQTVNLKHSINAIEQLVLF